MDVTPDFILSIVKWLWAPLSGWLLWDIKRHREKLDKAELDIIRLESKMMTKEETRLMLDLHTLPLLEDNKKFHESFKSIGRSVNDIKIMVARLEERQRIGGINDNTNQDRPSF